MTGAASGRELECNYGSSSTILWPKIKHCSVEWIDFSAKFEAEKHSFSGSAAEKSETKNFYIWGSYQIDFIPLEIFTEFPNLNTLDFWTCNLPTVKEGLFKPEFQKLEYLNLGWSRIETIEPNAFQYLVKLKWIRMYDNKIKTLSYRLFKNNPDLIYIGIASNKINSIHPNFFDGLEKLKLIDLEMNPCVDAMIGCETCQITQSDLKEKLQGCFNNCPLDTSCHNTH
jgi:hypothetical protein